MKKLLIHLLLLPLLPVLGCGGGAPAAPAAAAPPPEQSDAGVIGARDAERARKRSATSNTILTGAQGVATPANVAVKSLLGA